MSEQQVSTRPLQGKRVLVTRTRKQASSLSERLSELGATPVEFPTIQIVPPTDWSELDAALRCLYDGGYYDWVVFTSVNGVSICMERITALGYDPHALPKSTQIAAIGPATAQSLTHYGLQADLVPDEYIAESVAKALREDTQRQGRSLAGQHILLARAAEARKVLADELKQAGVLVDDVPAYSTVMVAHDNEQGRDVRQLLLQGKLDILTFTSSSTVRNFMLWLQSWEAGDRQALRDQLEKPHVSIACIGPITAQTARELGLRVDIEAREFTISGLLEAIVQYEERYDRTDSRHTNHSA